MGLLEECQLHFDSIDLYEVLKISKDASDNEVKRAYHKISLKIHPDRVEKDEKELSTKMFQVLGMVYGVLSDKEARRVYDETGEVDDDSSALQDRDWYDYWRLLFAKISVKDIEDFAKKYKDTPEELEDLKAAYVEYEGDMAKILDSVLCASIEDEPRFASIINDLIQEGEVPAFDKFSKESKKSKKSRHKKAAKEAVEAEQLKEELGVKEGDSLRNMIMQRHDSREKAADNFFAQLEAKYAQPKKKMKKK